MYKRLMSISILVIIIIGASLYAYNNNFIPGAPSSIPTDRNGLQVLNTPQPTNQEFSNLYKEFTAEEYEQALRDGKIVMLSFYATWCPFCRAEDKELKEAFNSIQKNNFVAFRVNYNDNQTNDYEERLAEEFDVAYQHTKVIVSDGQILLREQEPWNKEQAIEIITKL